MSFSLTTNTSNEALKTNVEPQLILVIDGLDIIYGLVGIAKPIKIGDPGLLIGSGWLIGGLSSTEKFNSAITLAGTTTRVQQQLDPDRGSVSSISSMQIALIDFNNSITKLITPGELVTDLLGRKCRVLLGFKESYYPFDFIDLFRGVVDDITSEPGKVTLNLSHPDQKKRQKIFLKRSTKLSSNINSSVTTLPVDDTTGFLVSPDVQFKTYVRIGDEIIRYTGTTATSFTGCTRGQLGTTAASHSDDDDSESIYRLTSDAMTLALKIMLSGWNAPFVSGVDVTTFNVLPSSVEANSIFFFNVDVTRDYGLTVGDIVTTTGATNGANNVSNKVITSIGFYENSSFLRIGGVSFVNEDPSPAVVSFRSQYDTLGEGLKMDPTEVDVDEHQRLYRLFLSSFNYDFYLKDDMEARDFINSEIYLPASAFATPRKSKSSVGYHIGPIPGSFILNINQTNVTNPEKIKIRRSTNRNFFNTIVYKYDENSLDEKFLKGTVVQDLGSKAQIEIGNKVQTVVSKGLRTALAADALSQSAANRKLKRYAYAAEMIEAVEVKYGVGFNSEVGDIVTFDGEGLSVSDINNASRDFAPRFMEITNKSIDIKTGQVVLTLTDTNFGNNRYGLISPSSRVQSGASTTVFTIEPDGLFSAFGIDEFRKWNRYTLPKVIVRNASSSIISPVVEIVGYSGNTITVSASLGFTPVAGYIMELSKYNFVTDQMQAVYAAMRDTGPFDNGESLYSML
jgi:hypothetical protein